MKLSISLFFICILFVLKTAGQELTQNIRGRVLDKQSQQPLPGANILVVGSNPAIGSSSDVNGYFKLSNVPVGRVTVAISFLGYQTSTVSNLILSSGKEAMLNIDLEEKVTTTEEVVVKASKPKSRALNEMTTVSARSFTVEETERYAGSRGDVARMASNYAGVSFANDSRNDIVIRGNSPAGLLWKLEDVDIPNPNHFAENGTTGGPVGMLNNNVLKNSDFLTGAFPAEYGNALSGVFDLKMRTGNADRHEFTGQIGFNGFELGAEGPILHGNNSSYMAFYRYSTLGVMDKMGISVGTSGVPEYQDLSFKMSYPVNNGLITVFGMAGKSSINMLDSTRKGTDLYNSDGQNLYNHSTLGSTGISYTRYIDNKTYAKFIVSGLYQDGGTNIDTLDINYKNAFRYLNHDISESRVSLTTIVGTKYNSRFNTKYGFTLDQMGFNANTKIYVDSVKSMRYALNSSKSLSSGPELWRSYYEVSYKITDDIAVNPGLQFMYFGLNNKYAIEPRIGSTWEYASGRRINIGYGLHSRTEALSTYFVRKAGILNSKELNKNLDFTKSHQFVLGHDWNINQDLRFKTETYYQYMFNVPVETTPSYFSLLNTGAYWGGSTNDSLTNKGTGYNYGVEFTFEKFLSRNYYFLITTSLFESKYKGSDGILRNTVFNGNYVINLLLGYEYPISSKWAITSDIKTAIAGGKRKIPIDIAKSMLTKQTEYDYSNAFKDKYPDFFKMDVKVGLRNNMRGWSQEWQIYIENVTDHKNIMAENYSRRQNGIVTTYQLGFFPMMLWRVNF